MRNIFGCFIFFMIIITPQVFSGNVYYVDATNGNDLNDGLSEASAWRSISKVNNWSFSAGDYILFKRGSIWREQLNIPSSGKATNPITFGTYGIGEKPIISGANVFTSWTHINGTVYKKYYISIETNHVFYNGTRLTKNDDTTSSVDLNEWDWDSNTLYVNIGENPDIGILEASQRNICIDSNGKNYITIDGLTIEKGGNTQGSGANMLLQSGSDHWIIQNCTIQHSNDCGILYWSDAGDNIVQNCTIQNNVKSGYYVWKNSTATSGSENYVKNNTFIGNGESGVSIEANYNIVENNTIYDNGTVTLPRMCIHIYSESADGGTGDNNIIRYNVGYNQIGSGQDGCGIEVDQWCDNNQIYYNIFYHNDGPGICIFDSEGNTAYNNICYDNCQNSSGGLTEKAEIRMTQYDDTTQNNIIINNIAYATTSGTYGIYVNSNASANSNTIDYNCWYRSSGDWYKWGASTGDTISGWRTASSQGVNDINSDHLFADASNNNFILLFNSPCIDTGKYVGLTEDFAGNTAPYGSAIDIGAYEYQGGNYPLIASIVASPTSGYVPLIVDFTPNINGGISPYTYSWDFGSGSSSSEQNPSYIYSYPGTYSVTLTVTDSKSNQAFDSITITASANPTYHLAISSVTGSPAQGEGGTTDPSPGSHSYSSGSSVQVKATPNTNYRFSKWTGDVSSSDAYTEEITVIMDKDKSISANFYTKCGDVNGNLSITPADAQAAFDIFLGRISNPTECEKENADVNCSGTETMPNITPADAQAIFDKFLGKSELPCDCSCNSRTGSVSAQMRQAPDINLIINDIELNLGEEIFVPIIVGNPFSIKAFGFDLLFPSEILEFVIMNKILSVVERIR